MGQMIEQDLNEVEALIQQNEESLKKLKALAARLRGETEDSNQRALQFLQDSRRDSKCQPPLQA